MATTCTTYYDRAVLSTACGTPCIKRPLWTAQQHRQQICWHGFRTSSPANNTAISSGAGLIACGLEGCCCRTNRCRPTWQAALERRTLHSTAQHCQAPAMHMTADAPCKCMMYQWHKQGNVFEIPLLAIPTQHCTLGYPQQQHCSDTQPQAATAASHTACAASLSAGALIRTVPGLL